jgi:hypothetical protein
MLGGEKFVVIVGKERNGCKNELKLMKKKHYTSGRHSGCPLLTTFSVLYKF